MYVSESVSKLNLIKVGVSLQTNVPQVAPELQSLQNEMSQLQMELNQLESQVSQLKAQQESGNQRKMINSMKNYIIIIYIYKIYTNNILFINFQAVVWSVLYRLKLNKAQKL